MRIIKPTCELIPMPTNKDALLKHIERCGRVCYKSEDKIAEGSAEKFIGNIIKRGHEAVLEHGSLILRVDSDTWYATRGVIKNLEAETEFVSFLRFTDDHGRYIVSGNIRALRDYTKAYCREFGEIPDLTRNVIMAYRELFPDFVEIARYTVADPCTFTQPIGVGDLITVNEHLHHHYQTLLFTCDRGVSHELVRHRPSSFCQESTRYCNYSKDGFGNEITVIDPVFFDPTSPVYRIWKRACEFAETAYFDLLNEGCTPQEARTVLPNSLKTELVMTAAMDEWRHVVKLRCDTAAHPQAREVMKLGLEALYGSEPCVFDDLWEEFCNV